MPNADLIYSADLAGCGCCGTSSSPVPDAGQKPGCGCQNGVYWMPPPPPPDFPPPYPPMPPYPPPHPFPPFPPCPCPDPIPEPKKTSTEGQICKLSKKANVINKMIEAIETKKKDVIVKAGGLSYNFNNVDYEPEGWTGTGEDSSYADTVLQMLKFERATIMAKIKELSDQLDDEVEDSTGVPKAGD